MSDGRVNTPKGDSRLHQLRQWFDAGERDPGAPRAMDDADGVDWGRIVPFALMHLACLFALYVGVSTTAIAVCVGLYLLRMFAITGFYHRYFSHRSFRTSRAAQFAFALLGASAVQRGPIWWAAHHRHHHAFSDKPQDTHSPQQHGFLWAHMGWFLSKRHFHPDLRRVRDLLQYPELRWLDRFDILVPFTLALALLLIGFVSTVLCYHGTYTVNSLAHGWGSRRYPTKDDSRNNAVLALITLGEGWHNNHHHYPSAVRQGFYWWEFDITYYLLRGLAAIGVIWDLNTVPVRIRDARETTPA
jgi:stearoyl-CoA desaturase (delta-9 desaturase)